MRKTVTLAIRDFAWVKRHMAPLFRHGMPAHRPYEHHGLYGSLVSHGRHTSGRLF